MKLAPALVPLEAWSWYMLFLDLLSAKQCLGNIDMMQKIPNTEFCIIISINRVMTAV